MTSYREGFVHLLYATILTQFVVIAVLLGGYSNQYVADDYFRAWVNSNYPWMGLMLQGQVDALLVAWHSQQQFLLSSICVGRKN